MGIILRPATGERRRLASCGAIVLLIASATPGRCDGPRSGRGEVGYPASDLRLPGLVGYMRTGDITKGGTCLAP
jgi:hypothetical protein